MFYCNNASLEKKCLWDVGSDGWKMQENVDELVLTSELFNLIVLQMPPFAGATRAGMHTSRC